MNGDCYSQERDGLTRFSDTSFVRARVVAPDAYGGVFVLDEGMSQVLKLSSRGEVVAHCGGYGWTELSFDQPADVSTDNGLDVFVADYGNHRIQRFDRNLSFLSSLPSAGAENNEELFGYPRSVARGISGAVYVVDGANERVVRIAADGSQRFFGSIEAAQGRLGDPQRIRLGENELAVIQDRNTLVMFDRFGNYIRTIGHEYFDRLTSFTLDRDTLYALDSCRVLRLTEQGVLIGRSRSICFSEDGIMRRFVDVAVEGGQCYLLTEHALYVVGCETLFAPEESK